MPGVLARCTPKPFYWLIGVFLFPVASFVFTAVLVRPPLLLAGVDLQGRLLLGAWLLVTALVASWAYSRDYRRLYYTLTADSLEVGRGDLATVIPFAEIESIVLALPARMSWWLRLQRFNPKARRLYRHIVEARELTLLLRLTRDRYLPLNLAYNYLAGGPELMAEFLRRHEAKVVGPETYTEAEIDGLASATSNTIKTIPRGGG